MVQWCRLVAVYWRAVAERDDSADPLPLPASLTVFLPLIIIFWALVVIGVRWLLGF